jgi:hypothetical protein
LRLPVSVCTFQVGSERNSLLHVIEKCQHLTELIHRIGGNTFRAIFLVEPFQALAGEVPYFHRINCSL